MGKGRGRGGRRRGGRRSEVGKERCEVAGVVWSGIQGVSNDAPHCKHALDDSVADCGIHGLPSGSVGEAKPPRCLVEMRETGSHDEGLVQGRLKESRPVAITKPARNVKWIKQKA